MNISWDRSLRVWSWRMSRGQPWRGPWGISLSSRLCFLWSWLCWSRCGLALLKTRLESAWEKIGSLCFIDQAPSKVKEMHRRGVRGLRLEAIDIMDRYLTWPKTSIRFRWETALGKRSRIWSSQQTIKPTKVPSSRWDKREAKPCKEVKINWTDLI